QHGGLDHVVDKIERLCHVLATPKPVERKTTMYLRLLTVGGIVACAALGLVQTSAQTNPPTLVGTKWAIVMGDNPDIWHYRFNSDHTLNATVHSCFGAPRKCYTTTDDGTWSQDGNSVSWDESLATPHVVQCTGTIDGNRMSGTAKNNS